MSDGRGSAGLARPALAVLAALSLVFMIALVASPVLLFAGAGLLYANGGGAGCTPGQAASGPSQPAVSTAARNSIPANYLSLFKSIGATYNVPWVILAGIGKVESDFGRTTLPGVHSGANAFGAAGPMQIGIGGAAGDTWGGAPVHPASQRVNGVATDADGDGIASVYDPADAIAGAAKYLIAHGVTSSVPGAIFAYNHLDSYVQSVLGWASTYASGGYAVSQVTVTSAIPCQQVVSGKLPGSAVMTAITFAEQQLGKPYLWGGTGPDAFDCSGLVMQAYRAAGIYLPRTSDQQWQWGPRVPAGQEQPGDLVFFAGGDGTVAHPGHVGLVIGRGMMIEAYAPGVPIRITSYAGRGAVGFTRPIQHAGAVSLIGGP